MLVIMCGSVQNQVNYIDGWLMVMQYAHMYVDRLIEPIVCPSLVPQTDRALSLCVQPDLGMLCFFKRVEMF